MGVYDAESESEIFQASVWSGSNFQNLSLLETQSGERLQGRVLGVTDNGYAVGSSSLGGFIWHDTWSFAQLFNNWALSEFGISIPTWVTSVDDIFFDGVNLNFALQGSAYFLSVPDPLGNNSVPETTTWLLLTIALTIFWHRERSRKLSGHSS